MSNKKIVRGVGNPTWIKDPEKEKIMKEIHKQWCKDNGYPARGKYGRRKT